MVGDRTLELRRFWTALAFYTRLPVPEGKPLGELSQGSRYFPAVGWIVGGIGAVVYGLAGWGLPHIVVVILAVGAMVLATGALHEDGFADTCDGLGGGWSREDALRIMKDSRLGTYGAVGLVLLLAIKLGALVSLDASSVAWTLIAAQASSRFFALTLTRSLPYVQSEASSKSGGLQPLQGTDYQIAAVIGLVQGGVQALSRSYYSRLIPLNQAAEFYGFYNMLGKFAAILGPVLMGLSGLVARSLLMPADPTEAMLTQVGQESARWSIASIILLFLIGGYLFWRVDETQGRKEIRNLQDAS